jgi:glycerol-3-phosphate dehydrogenase
MPISEAVARVLDGALPVRDAVEGLLKREPKADER